MTVLPSFAQRWLLPRIARWRERYPDFALEIDASISAVDILREGFHAAVRQGAGPWPGLASERLFGQPPMIVVGSPSAARRLLGAQPEALAREPLLGDADLWKTWFAAAGLRTNVTTVAVFNDAGLMLQAAEQNLGLALTREILAADALGDGRLVQLSPVSIVHTTRSRTISSTRRACASGRRSWRCGNGCATSSTALSRASARAANAGRRRRAKRHLAPITCRDACGTVMPMS